MYYNLEIKKGEETKTYELRLDARASVALEKALGKNPLGIFIGVSETNLPKIDDLITVLEAALNKKHPQVSGYDVYDELIEEGKGFEDLINITTEIFIHSGLIKANTLEEAKKQMGESKPVKK